MPITRVLTVLLLGAALGASGCTTDDDIGAPTPNNPSPPVTEIFTGTLTRNGADTHPFSVSTSGTVIAALSRLDPEPTAIVGLSLGTWNGSACQTIISNDRATQGVGVTGTADRQGRLCVRIYDAEGTLPGPADYELTVTHP